MSSNLSRKKNDLEERVSYIADNSLSFAGDFVEPEDLHHCFMSEPSLCVPQRRINGPFRLSLGALTPFLGA